MKNWIVELEYKVPEFADISVQAEDRQQAEDIALFEFEKQNPEAVDIELISVKEEDSHSIVPA